jgi:hypothetical protein
LEWENEAVNMARRATTINENGTGDACVVRTTSGAYFRNRTNAKTPQNAQTTCMREDKTFAWG